MEGNSREVVVFVSLGCVRLSLGIEKFGKGEYNENECKVVILIEATVLPDKQLKS